MASEQEYKDRVEAPVNETTTLYRPVGQEELNLIRSSGYREFPPRLPRQPIFYPVLNEEYATQIARDWNTKSGSRRGFVTRFQVRTEDRRFLDSSGVLDSGRGIAGVQSEHCGGNRSHRGISRIN
jgi:hypothetical protein